mgnify:CR=1 FL=1
MNVTIEVWLPVPAEIFAIFLGALVAYLVYVTAKFVVSLWTGA